VNVYLISEDCVSRNGLENDRICVSVVVMQTYRGHGTDNTYSQMCMVRFGLDKYDVTPSKTNNIFKIIVKIFKHPF
jgi:hypothetical protein